MSRDMYADRAACTAPSSNVREWPSTWASKIVQNDIAWIVEDGPEEDDAPVTDKAKIGCLGLAAYLDAEPQRDLKIVVFATEAGGLNLIVDRPDGERRLSFVVGPDQSELVSKVSMSDTCRMSNLTPMVQLLDWLMG